MHNREECGDCMRDPSQCKTNQTIISCGIKDKPCLTQADCIIGGQCSNSETLLNTKTNVNLPQYFGACIIPRLNPSGKQPTLRISCEFQKNEISMVKITEF